MGREIRRVPANWEHPKNTHGDYQPMYDESATESLTLWLEEFEKFKAGELNRVAEEHGYDENNPYSAFCDWHGAPPDHEYCRPKWDESDAVWWQVYETVSEGTPVTPPFETQDELVNYLVLNGDFWDQKRRGGGKHHGMSCEPWPRETAEKFVYGSGWAPTMVMSGGEIKSGVEFLATH